MPLQSVLEGRRWLSMLTRSAGSTPSRQILLRLVLSLFVVPLIATFTRAQSIQYTQNIPEHTRRSVMRVDPITLGLGLEVPIANYRGRGGTDAPIGLAYSSKVWRLDITESFLSPLELLQTRSYPRYSEWAKAGWTSSADLPIVEWVGHQQLFNANGLPECESCGEHTAAYINRILIHMPGGTSNELRLNDTPVSVPTHAGTYYAVDGSNLRYEAASSTDGILFLPDGSRYILHHSTGSFQYIDRNGNTLTYDLPNRRWTDTLGRLFDVPLPASPTAATYTYNLPSTTSTPVSYSLRWSTLQNALANSNDPLRYDSNMTPSGPGDSYTLRSPALFEGTPSDRVYGQWALFNPVVLAEIILPNGQSYEFSYNVWGEITKVVYPTGAYERFEHGPVAGVSFLQDPYKQGNRGVLNRWLSPTGLVSDEVHWHYDADREEDLLTVSVTEPDGTVTQHLMTALDSTSGNPFGYSLPTLGMQFEKRKFAPGPGVMLTRTLTKWESADAAPEGWSSGTRNPRPTKKVSILLDTGTGNALTSTTKMSYDDDLNVVSTKQYAFTSILQSTAQTSAIDSISEGSLIRTDETTFLVNDPDIDASTRTAYRARNLLSLPTSTRVKNGSSTPPVAQTRITYDETALLTYSETIDRWTDPATNRRGLPTTTGVWLNTTESYLETHAEYDQFGNVIKTEDGNENESEIEYDSAYFYAYPTKATSAVPDPAGEYGSDTALSTTAVYDVDTGLMTALTDPNGQTTNYSYDAINRLETITRPTGGGSTNYAYGDTPGDLYIRTRTAIDATRIAETYQYFDGLGRPCRTFLNEGSSIYLTSDTEYDSMGRSWRSSNPYRTTSLTAPINPNEDWTTTEYDDSGRVISVTTSDGAVVTSGYGGNTSGTLATVVTVTDQAGRLRRSLTDVLGRLTRVDEPDQDSDLGSLDSPSQPTTYSYDTLGNLLGVSQGSQSRSFLYDSLSRLLSATNPESGTICYGKVINSQCRADGYDANGNRLYKTDARGIRTGYEYDALNRNISVTYTDDPSDTPKVRRRYDGADNGKGRLWKTETEHEALTTINSYDAVGRPTSQSQHLYWNNQWSTPFTVGATYTFSGQVLTQTYPSGHEVSYTHDTAGRTDGFAGNLGEGGNPRTYSSEIIYSPFGGMAKEKLHTDTPVHNKLFYNSRGQLAEIRVGTSYTGPTDETSDRGAIVNHYSNQPGCSGATCDATDNNGNLRRQEIFIPNTDTFRQFYEYDSLNRLQSARENRNGGAIHWQQTYSYDRYGNRRIDLNPNPPPGKTFGGVSNVDFELDSSTNRLLAPGDPALEEPLRRMRYDAAGNLKKDTYTGAGDRTYDAESRMITSAGTPAASYSYDGDGRRVRRILGTTETWQIYGFENELLAEYAAGGSDDIPQKEYGYRNGQLLITADVNSEWGAAPTYTGPDPIVSGMQIKLENLTELRAAVNQLRQHAGLPAFVFTVDPNPERNVTVVKADHIRQLRTALEQARTHLGLSTGGYQHTTLTENSSLIYAIDFQELRDQILSAWESGVELEINWLVADHLGTPRMIIDETGSLANMKRHDYLPFGEELFGGPETNPGMGGRLITQGYAASDAVRQKFTSQERDNETGLDYFVARYHSWTLGRFTSTDPYVPVVDDSNEELLRRYFQQPQNWNRYSYCINNPLLFVDPNGLGWYVKKGADVGHPEWFDDKKVDQNQYELVSSYYYKSVESGKYVALNPFKNEAGYFDTVEEASAVYQGYIINQALGDVPRLPDYASVNAGFLTGGLNLTLEAHGNLFGGFEIYPRYPLNENSRTVSGFLKFNGSIAVGWLDQFETPSEAQASKFLTGPSTNGSFGAKGFGVGRTWSPGNGTGTNIGIFTPGGSFSGSTAGEIGRFPRFRWRN